MIILICGSRDWQDKNLILSTILSLRPTKIIHGACRGADIIAGECAKELGILVDEYPADWAKHGKAAGPKRNQQMLDEGKPDVVVAFHDNIDSSKGTKDMVNLAKNSKIKFKVIGH